MSRRSRLILIALLVAGLSPGLWWRMPLPPLQHDAGVIVTRLTGLPDHVGQLEVLGAWELSSPNEHFGGFSALAMLDDATLLAASDNARMMRMTLPLGKTIDASRLGFFRPGGARDKRLSDLEALAHDPKTGTIWAAYENLNTIERVDSDSRRRSERLAAMAEWPTRSGAEAIERLPGGRFLLIGESRGGGKGSPALLYPGDPLDGGEPISFRFAGLPGYSPTGLAALPDGRVLVLMRTWFFAIPPNFGGAIVLADPSDIEAGEIWRGKTLAKLSSPLPLDNYEGVAVSEEPEGALSIWLISDDNFMRSQRTLLLNLGWDPMKTAPE